MLLICFGTRPELLKIEPLLKYWKSIGFKDFGIWLTGQHKELCNKLLINWEFKERICIFHNIYESTKFRVDRLGAIISAILAAGDEWIGPDGYHSPRFGIIKSLLVLGDTASSFGCALYAFHKKIPVIHLEAGLRSFDNENPYPEEFYRRSISCMASLHLCPTEENAINLEFETVPGKIKVVGNTILDSIKDLIPGKSNTIICTLHRRENLSNIKEWFEALEYIAEKYSEFEFILPIHKNPEIYKFKETFKYIKCVDPLSHNEFIDLLKDCAAIISDSGGVAEEGSWFKKAIFLCRKETERPEASDFYTKCPTPAKLIELFDQEYKIDKTFYRPFKCPFGDGNSAKRITDILKDEHLITL